MSLSDEKKDASRVYVEAKCFACGALIFSELYRAAVSRNWTRLTERYESCIVAHLALCPTTEPAA